MISPRNCSIKPKFIPPIYPVFLAPIPVLVLLAVNIQQANSLTGLRLVLGGMLMAGLVLGLLSLILRGDWPRAALITAILVLYANLFGWLVWWSNLPVAALAVWLLWKACPSTKFQKYANLLTLSLFFTLVVFIGWQAGERDWENTRRQVSGVDESQPDIYFIVLDSYTSHQLLLDRFGYDNTSFLDDLKALDFQVGDCQSGYPDTDYSLAWSLNPDASVLPDGMQLWEMIRGSQVRTTLEQRGYQTVAFATGFVWTEFMDADVYYQPPVLFENLNVFEIYYLQHTAFNLLLHRYFDLDTRLSQIFRERTLTLLEHLPEAAAMQGPQFVFAHIVQPHPPFVFDADGNAADWREYTLPGNDTNPTTRAGYSVDGYAAGYVVEVQYIEGAILPRLAAIVEADPNSVIILAGDHGPWFSETQQGARAILCAVRGTDLPLDTRLAFDELTK